MTLYEIVNKINEKGYIGITQRNVKKRWFEHLYSLRANSHGNAKLQNAFNKYGEKSFHLIIRNTFNSLEELNKAEKETIEKEKERLYNLSPGGNAFFHYMESKQKISKSQLKPVVGMNMKTGEIKEYVSVTGTAKDGFDPRGIGGACKLSKYGNRNKLSSLGWVWMYKKDFNIKQLEERRQNALRGKIRNERAIMGKSLKTGEILTFKSSLEASRNGFSAQCVHQACVGGRVKSHKRYVWVFCDIGNPQSLLEERYKVYIQNPPKTGPK